MSLEKLEFENGLTTYVDHMPNALTNSVRMFVPYGSVQEKPGDEGVAHALEHAVFVETDLYEDKSAWRQYAMLNGMRVNARTSYSNTVHMADGITLEPGIRHLGEVLCKTKLPEDEVEQEMKSVRREALTALDNTGVLHMVASDYAMFGIPYGRRVIGYHDKLDFSHEQIKSAYERNYALDKMAMVVVGAVNPKEVEELALRYLPSSEKRSAIDPVVAQINTHSEGLVSGLVREESSNVHFQWCYPVDSALREKLRYDSIKFRVATAVIRENCLTECRDNKGISYDGGVAISNHNHPDAWSISGSVTTDAEHIPTARQIFKDIFAQSSDAYTDDNVQGAMASFKYGYLSSLISPTDRSEAYIGQLVKRQRQESAEELLHRVNTLEISQIRATIDEIIDYAAKAPKFEHLTGKRESIGEVGRIIDLSEIA